MQTVTLQDLTKTLPHLDPVPIEALLHREIEKNPGKIVVLDDDPTGVQTVHDIYVYTDCTLASIRESFSRIVRLRWIWQLSPRRPISPSKSFYAEILLCAGIIRWNRF